MAVPAVAAPPILAVSGVDKTFTMYLQGGQRLPVLRGLTFEVRAGECVALGGVSGAGKSSILKMVYGNYAADRGAIVLRRPGGDVDGAVDGAVDSVIDIAAADPRQVLRARRDTMGYVSQFLRCVPRVGALRVVAEPLVERGVPAAEARERTAELLTRLAIPERLWSLPPATFSGGEQQRVNIARGFVTELPLLLLDEPTASLDARNRDVVTELIREKRARGVAMLGIFHDAAVRDAVADRVVGVEMFAPAVGAAA
ncbi:MULTISPECIES: phosphonate C-P lyase system protein PhnL [unclassified Pseudofrankia]|uniref:phosphonate C-P lyase system protein PhnL n=1 Tax=unclassified Pseudofrankia TaxID=2994372 RepID=UPI0008D9C2F3|nr:MULTISPECIES: phosphonate C-P lyase system protein PhnL [unclassified Pseudofrankia]MDT3443075.1 phosphonate C-P lyase system protein PhnL [Pseudofrankia sp. BMG5.37]OHV49942.1 phosphonate C-P lyase system protein PhnL [Pseudofrankia sp. BMG5.36]